MSNFNERLTVLSENNVIGKDGIKLINLIEKYMLEQHDILLTEDNASMLITHIVMTNERIKNKNAVSKLPSVVESELKIDDNFELANQVVTDIIKMFNEFDEDEYGYMLMHIINLLRSRG